MSDDEARLDTGIGLNIRNLRKGRGWTLGRLSEKTGIDKAALSKIELGKTEPRVGTALKIATALAVGVGALFNRPGMREEEIPWPDEATDAYKRFMMRNIATLDAEEQHFLQRAMLVADRNSRERDELWPRALDFYRERASVQDVMKDALTTTPGEPGFRHIFLVALYEELGSVVRKWRKVDRR